MKRNELVGKLVNEGLSEKTLSKLTDNQINILAERMLGEQMKQGSLVVPPNTPAQTIKNYTGQGLNVAIGAKATTEESEMSEELKGNQKKIDKNHNGKIDAQDFKILNGQKKMETKENALPGLNVKGSKKETIDEKKPSAGLSKEKKSEVVKKAKKGEDIGKKGKGFEKLADKAAKEYGSKEKGEKVAAAAMWKNIKEEDASEKNKWVKNLAEEKFFHNFTSKNEIMELIHTKLNESNALVQHGPKVKKGHNGIPEFMSYDAIVGAAEPTTKPTTKPGTKPGTTPKPKHPYGPSPADKPKPKAQMGEETKEAPVKDPKIKEAPKKDDKPKHPYKDAPGKHDKPERKA